MQTIAEADGYKVAQSMSGMILLTRSNGSTFRADSAYEAIRATPEPIRGKLLKQWEASR